MVGEDPDVVAPKWNWRRGSRRPDLRLRRRHQRREQRVPLRRRRVQPCNEPLVYQAAYADQPQLCVVNGIVYVVGGYNGVFQATLRHTTRKQLMDNQSSGAGGAPESLRSALSTTPLAPVATAWHCCLEFFSVSTRLPPEFRLTPAHAARLLESEVFGRMGIHDLPSVQSTGDAAVGGRGWH